MEIYVCATCFQHCWVQRFRWCETVPAILFIQWPSEKDFETQKTVFICKAKINRNAMFSHDSFWNKWDSKPKAHVLWSSTHPWQACIITGVVDLTSYHCVTVGTLVLSAALSLSWCLNRLAPLNENPPDWHVVCRQVLLSFTHWFSAHISEESSSSMAPGDVLWHEEWGKGLPYGSWDELREVSKGGCRERERGGGIHELNSHG